MIIACILWVISVLANALCDSIKQSKAVDKQDRMWHYSKYLFEWTSRFFSGVFARTFLEAWVNWEYFDEWHYITPVAIFGTVVIICIPLHWWVRMGLKQYWNKRYETVKD